MKTCTKGMTSGRENRLPMLCFLLGVSGFCALVYQMAWLREFRLVFGGSSPATAAVLAIFMGALGAGGALFGRRAETSDHPLRLYGWIELGVGITALLTPVMLSAVWSLYLRTGGTAALGLFPATLLQLLLATLVLAPPCLLMGGSMPAAVKWVASYDDPQRGVMGVLYGVNALGALAGVIGGTFWLLENLGIRATVAGAAVLNLLIGLFALAIARRQGALPAAPPMQKGVPPQTEEVVAPLVPAVFVYAVAGLTGFTFFLGEMVWARMLAPLLGSTVYGFGMMLALALAGIGIGGLWYRRGWAGREGAVTPQALAVVSGAQALAMALPWALGDRLAVFAIYVADLKSFGLAGMVAGWILVLGPMVLPVSVIAGIQFPLLVGLLGRGGRDAGRHAGHAYAANTVGTILGCLVGGFVLLPWLTAPGAWRLVTALMLGLSLASAVMANRSHRAGSLLVLFLLWGFTGALAILPRGPTAVWRHQPIGYGRVDQMESSVPALRAWMQFIRGGIALEFEGREASVAVVNSDNGYAFYINGKSDGSAFGDAPTQVLTGLIPSLLHPHPRRAFVVGLGTGSTAGWLAEVPGMERVDVSELEPAMYGLARDFYAPINRNVMDKPNVRMITGDAREALLCSRETYDVIVSEPSNPYRAGISTLFTEEFYAAVRSRLAPKGIFAQWMQVYEVDAATVRLVYGTLNKIFPHVETWLTQEGDLQFVCHAAPPAYTMEHLRSRIQQPPFAEALARTWYVSSVEGVLAHHLASPAFAQYLAGLESLSNTDDRNRLEYGFARALALNSSVPFPDVFSIARRLQADTPPHLRDQLDQNRLKLERIAILAVNELDFTVSSDLVGDDQRRAEAFMAFSGRKYGRVLDLWAGEAVSPFERLMLMESAAMAGTPEQLRPLLVPLHKEWPADTRFAAAQSSSRHGAPEAAVEHLREGFAALHQQIWARPDSVTRALVLAGSLAVEKPELAPALYEALRDPFPAGMGEPARLSALRHIAPYLPADTRLSIVELFEPDPVWSSEFLALRLQTYIEMNDPRVGQAESDLAEFLSDLGSKPLDELPLDKAAPQR